MSNGPEARQDAANNELLPLLFLGVEHGGVHLGDHYLSFLTFAFKQLAILKDGFPPSVFLLP
jgi:hypothetical protein